jgi:D-alanyl-D-alanine carboxypeptidase (penicillin-binding protein 5/6)
VKFKFPKHHRAIRCVIIISLIIIAFVGLCIAYSSKIELPTASPELVTLKSLTQSAANPVWPDYGSGAVGAIGFDGVLTQHGDQSARPIASLTKIITALLVLQAKPLNDGEDGPNIELTQADLEIYNQSVADGAAVEPIYVGSSMTERQALETMLLPSAANYSVTLAIWAYGSVNAYLSATDAWLASHDLTQTNIVDTSGLSSDDVSSPSDLVEIGKLALANPSLASIVTMKQATIPDVGTISNTNGLLGTVGINGIKTGSTSAAGACLLFSSIITVGPKKVTIVGTILGGDDRGQENSDIVKLIKSIELAFHDVKLTSINQQYASYTTAWGQTSKLVTLQDTDAIVWSDTPILIKVKADKISLANSGERKGTVAISIGNKVIQQPLIFSNSITEPNILWRLIHLFKN